ncbi:MAG: hypothetical protein ACRCXZ_08220 [Patescibacteria group bacterium]
MNFKIEFGNFGLGLDLTALTLKVDGNTYTGEEIADKINGLITEFQETINSQKSAKTSDQQALEELQKALLEAQHEISNLKKQKASENDDPWADPKESIDDVKTQSPPKDEQFASPTPDLKDPFDVFGKTFNEGFDRAFGNFDQIFGSKEAVANWEEISKRAKQIGKQPFGKVPSFDEVFKIPKTPSVPTPDETKQKRFVIRIKESGVNYPVESAIDINELGQFDPYNQKNTNQVEYLVNGELVGITEFFTEFMIYTR